MTDNIDLFNEEIEEIRELSEIDVEVFYDVLNCTRGVIADLGDEISPAAVVDIIEGAVGHLIYESAYDDKPVTVGEAVERAVASLRLIDEFDEIDDMFDEKHVSSDAVNIGKNR